MVFKIQGVWSSSKAEKWGHGLFRIFRIVTQVHYVHFTRLYSQTLFLYNFPNQLSVDFPENHPNPTGQRRCFTKLLIVINLIGIE